ncbi:UNVERIFIED_CONTAM: hypothetical protein HDU68_002681 [Siphonaria sp. JEL0065]|nr:hypothetical protein HDU68_002681 [Siphonaria sp. JEL0065]
MKNLITLPPETLFKIFLQTNSPKCILTVIPRVCKTFAAVLSHRSNPILANVEIISEEEEDGANGSIVALIQSPERPTLLSHFKRVRVVGASSATCHDSVGGTSIRERVDSENSSVVYVGIERSIKVHVGAIPDSPETLVNYIAELLRRGISAPTGFSKRHVRVLFGTVQVAGRRGNTSAKLLGRFLREMKPVNITLWHWDSDLISNLPATAATSLRLPNMRADGHIQARDLSLLASGGPVQSHLKRLELFRPMPRQPWGLEASAFAPLSVLTGLRELVVRSGRLIGSHDTLVGAVLALKRLRILELPWNIDSRLGSRILRELPELESLQYLQVTSPDFFQSLPTHPSRPFANGGSSPLLKTPAVRLKSLGLNFMEPDSADVAVMVEGIIRCLPELETLFIRINSRPSNDNNASHASYDFFGTIPRELLSRWLRRLESGCLNLTDVGLELGLRMWGSRKSYADELVFSFSTSRMKVRMCSPVGRIG